MSKIIMLATAISFLITCTMVQSSPTTSDPILVPTRDPTSSPTTSKPTSEPSSSPIASDPILVPTRDPTPSTTIPPQTPANADDDAIGDECGPTAAVGPCPAEFCKRNPTYEGCPSTTIPPPTPPPSSPTTSKPTSSVPSSSPIASDPTSVPTRDPTSSPTTSKPTSVPSSSPTTSTPTPAPTDSPRTPTLTTTTATVQSATWPPTDSPCPKNCGVGDCDAVGQCKSCDDDKFLAKGKVDGVYFGKCVSRLYCKGRKVTTGSLEGKSCRCSDDHCHYCVQSAAVQTCKKCKDGFYLLNNKCIEECPDTMTSMGYSNWGRTCQDPFQCKGSSSVGENSFGCKCAAVGNTKSDCHVCDFNAGEYGQHCLQCRNNMYLNHTSNECQEECNNVPGIIQYAVGSFGGECRTPFTCTRKKDSEGNKCKCAKEAGGNSCEVCDWGLNGSRCTRCGNSQYLWDDTCLTECPPGNGLKAVGDGKYGRECLHP